MSSLLKYLGDDIDNSFTFKQYMESSVEKVTEKVNYFKNNCKNLKSLTRILVYKTLISPHFFYCPTVM